MVSLRFLAAVIFATNYSVSAVAASFPEPHIFLNLTRDEFMHKRWEIRHDDPVAITKRAVVGEEWRNSGLDPMLQAVVEARAQDCVDKYGSSWRSFRGRCLPISPLGLIRMEVACGIPPETAGIERRTNVPCGKTQKCDTVQAWNYAGRLSKFPYCKDIIRTVERPAPPINVPERPKSPIFDGKKTLPDEAMSPGTIDTLDAYFYLIGQSSKQAASWEYRGHWASGWGFLADSAGLTSSFSCLGCPPGDLHVETDGFKGIAEGFTLTRVSL